MYKVITLLALCIFGNLYAKDNNLSVLLFNVSEERMVYKQHTDQVRSIASITKLMTAMVALDHSTNMNSQVKLVNLVKSNLPIKTYTRKELFEAMLIRSDNGAAETLASDYPGGRDAFMKAMNKKTVELGMISTFFKDPTGLSISNISTANEVAVMIIAASNYPDIKEISTKKQTHIEAPYKKKIRKLVLNNTNRRVLHEFDNVMISKTGFTNPAGFCVAMMTKRREKTDHEHVIVILGAKNSNQRVDKVKEIMYNNIIAVNHER